MHEGDLLCLTLLTMERRLPFYVMLNVFVCDIQTHFDVFDIMTIHNAYDPGSLGMGDKGHMFCLKDVYQVMYDKIHIDWVMHSWLVIHIIKSSREEMEMMLFWIVSLAFPSNRNANPCV